MILMSHLTIDPHLTIRIFPAELTTFRCSTWPWSGRVFFILWLSNTVSDHIEMIFMSHLTIETPPDHPYISSRVNYIQMFHLTMVRWGFFQIMSFKYSLWAIWNDFDAVPDHRNPTWPFIYFQESQLHLNVPPDHGQVGFFSYCGFQIQSLIILKWFWCHTWP